MTGHDLQITRWSQYWKRATRAGHAYAEVSERFRKSEDPFWTSDRRRNLMRGGFWIISLIVAVVASGFFGSAGNLANIAIDDLRAFGVEGALEAEYPWNSAALWNSLSTAAVADLGGATAI